MLAALPAAPMALPDHIFFVEGIQAGIGADHRHRRRRRMSLGGPLRFPLHPMDTREPGQLPGGGRVHLQDKCAALVGTAEPHPVAATPRRERVNQFFGERFRVLTALTGPHLQTGGCGSRGSGSG